MRVVLIEAHPGSSPRSMRRYAEDLRRNLAALGIDCRAHRLPRVFGRLARPWPRVNKYLAYLDLYLLSLPGLVALRFGKADVLHVVDQGIAALALPLPPSRLVVTCHDVIAIARALSARGETRASVLNRMQQRANLAGIRRAARIVAVSERTGECLAPLVRDDMPIAVIPNAIAPSFSAPGPTPFETAPSETPPSETAPQPFFLHVGGNAFYKNRRGVVALFGRLGGYERFARHRLVLAGEKPDAALADAVARSPSRDRIDVLVEPGDAELVALYRAAEALLFVSLEEGFGWPILEAQACGCPVVTSDRSPMREVAGGAAILVDPADPERAAETIAARISQRADMARTGLSNCARYRAEAIYPRYLEEYRRLADARRGG